MNTWYIYIVWRVLVNRVWRASAQICDMVPSGTLWFLREHSGPFGDNMVPSRTLWWQYGVDLCSTQRGLRCIWDSRPPYCSWYVICYLSGSVCDSRSCQAIQYTRGSQSYEYLFFVMCTLYLHTLLTEFYTHEYSYIADDTAHMWVWRRSADFLTTACVYEHFDAVVSW